MIYDRVLEDSLGFIRRMLWSKKGKHQTKKPFQPTRTLNGEFGLIHLLEGRDTPRAVRTWMYSPKRQHLNSAQMVETSVPMDLHLYLDFLGPLPDHNTPDATQERAQNAAQRQQGQVVPTHRLQILKASHFLNPDGFYNYELVFWKDIDFHPPQGSSLSQEVIEKVSIKFTDALAAKCLKIASPLKYKTEDWQGIVDELLEQLRAKMNVPRGEGENSHQ